jgi:hypothetical protein
VAVDHEVDGWYAQQITVQYERARGLRGTNQRMSSEYEVSGPRVKSTAIEARGSRPSPLWRSTWSADARGLQSNSRRGAACPAPTRPTATSALK